MNRSFPYRLYIGRHGSTRSSFLRDEDRILSKKGRQEGHMMGAHLQRLGHIPHYIYYSSLLRSQQTAQIYFEYMPSTHLAYLPGILPGDNPQILAKDVNFWPGSAFLVSHLPFVAYFISTLIGYEVQSFAFPENFVGVLSKANSSDPYWFLEDLLTVQNIP